MPRRRRLARRRGAREDAAAGPPATRRTRSGSVGRPAHVADEVEVQVVAVRPSKGLPPPRLAAEDVTRVPAPPEGHAAPRPRPTAVVTDAGPLPSGRRLDLPPSEDDTHGPRPPLAPVDGHGRPRPEVDVGVRRTTEVATEVGLGEAVRQEMRAEGRLAEVRLRHTDGLVVAPRRPHTRAGGRPAGRHRLRRRARAPGAGGPRPLVGEGRVGVLAGRRGAVRPAHERRRVPPVDAPEVAPPARDGVVGPPGRAVRLVRVPRRVVGPRGRQTPAAPEARHRPRVTAVDDGPAVLARHPVSLRRRAGRLGGDTAPRPPEVEVAAAVEECPVASPTPEVRRNIHTGGDICHLVPL